MTESVMAAATGLQPKGGREGQSDVSRSQAAEPHQSHDGAAARSESLASGSAAGLAYRQFIASKAPAAVASGVDAGPMCGAMFDYQRDATAFCLKQGRAALFLDTGLGKTICELEFARQAAEATNGRALILTPLAVAKQIEREAQRFGFGAAVIREQSDARDGISICNYDRLDKLDLDEFGGVILDESSIVKNFAGKTARSLISAVSSHRFRLAATATPAPNDHMELGQHAELLGIMDSVEMLSRFFINDASTASQQWRIKKHAEDAFWDWMASWCRAAETPADLGYDASRFVLPPLNTVSHRVSGTNLKLDGLFATEMSATSMFDLKRQTAAVRADGVASLVCGSPESWLVWCDTDAEADALKAAIGADAVEIRGSHAAELKEARVLDFVTGKTRVLISKPSILGYGLNFQHCANMAFVGRSFSYEAWYQAVRRCWRFGQTKPVNVHLMVAEGEDQIGRVIARKEADHAKMKAAMRAAMLRANGRSVKTKVAYEPNYKARVPAWLG